MGRYTFVYIAVLLQSFVVLMRGISMKKRLRLWIQPLLSWCQAKRKLLMIIGSIALAAGCIAFLVSGYALKWDWTGFTAQGNGASYQPEKTLWDWMQLLGVLAIPVAVAW